MRPARTKARPAALLAAVVVAVASVIGFAVAVHGSPPRPLVPPTIRLDDIGPPPTAGGQPLGTASAPGPVGWPDG